MSDARVLDSRVEGLSHSFRISLAADRVNAAIDARLREIGRTARIPGFRPGRASRSVLRHRYGNDVRSAVVDRMAIEVARTLIAERDLEPNRRPTIDIDETNDADSDAVVFTLVLQVAPTVEPGRVEGFRLQRLRVCRGAPELANRAEADLRRQLFDALLDEHDFAVPDAMVAEEYARIVSGFEAEVDETIDATLEYELQRIAERRVRLAMLLTEIGRRHGIEISAAEVEALVELQVERDPEHQAEVIDYYLDHPSALAELQAPLFENRVVDYLLERCEIEELVMEADALRARLDQA